MKNKSMILGMIVAASAVLTMAGCKSMCGSSHPAGCMCEKCSMSSSQHPAGCTCAACAMKK